MLDLFRRLQVRLVPQSFLPFHRMKTRLRLAKNLRAVAALAAMAASRSVNAGLPMHLWLASMVVTFPCRAGTTGTAPPLQDPPTWSDDTLGGMVFAHVTKTTPFNSSDLALLRRYPVVQFDKAQNLISMPGAGTLERRVVRPVLMCPVHRLWYESYTWYGNSVHNRNYMWCWSVCA